MMAAAVPNDRSRRLSRWTPACRQFIMPPECGAISAGARMFGAVAIHMSAKFRIHEWTAGESSTSRPHSADPTKESPYGVAFAVACFRSANRGTIGHMVPFHSIDV
jgi:hypothetical protein